MLPVMPQNGSSLPFFPAVLDAPTQQTQDFIIHHLLLQPDWDLFNGKDTTAQTVAIWEMFAEWRNTFQFLRHMLYHLLLEPSETSFFFFSSQKLVLHVWHVFLAL